LRRPGRSLEASTALDWSARKQAAGHRYLTHKHNATRASLHDLCTEPTQAA